MSSGKWQPFCFGLNVLRQTVVCLHQWTESSLAQIRSSLVAWLYQGTIWTKADLVRNGSLEINSSEIWTKIKQKSFKKIPLRLCPWWPCFFRSQCGYMPCLKKNRIYKILYLMKITLWQYGLSCLSSQIQYSWMADEYDFNSAKNILKQRYHVICLCSWFDNF